MGRYVIKLVCLLAGFAAGMYTGVYVHELGHQAACLYLGYESGGIVINMHESSHTCVFDGTTSDADVLFVRAGGGGLATAVFGAALAVFWPVRTRWMTGLGDFVLCLILAGLVSQSINLAMEAGAAESYDYATRALGITCTFILVCCTWYGRLPKRKPGRRWPSRVR